MENSVLELPEITEKPRHDLTPAPAAGPMNMLMQAMRAGLSLPLADARAMWELQKEWEANEARKAYMLAMSGFASEGVTIYKNKTVDYTPRNGTGRIVYKHAELSDVTAAVCPALAKHKLSHRWDVQQSADGNLVTVTCRITHAHGHSESVTLTGGQDATGNKNPIQQTGSTISYLQRYTLLAITGMSTSGDDDDGRGGVKDREDDYTDQQQRDAEENFRRVEERNQPRQPPATPQTDFCPQERFDANLPDWAKMIFTGEKDTEKLIKVVNKRQALTEAQKATLRALPVNHANA